MFKKYGRIIEMFKNNWEVLTGKLKEKKDMVSLNQIRGYFFQERRMKILPSDDAT